VKKSLQQPTMSVAVVSIVCIDRFVLKAKNGHGDDRGFMVKFGVENPKLFNMVKSKRRLTRG